MAKSEIRSATQSRMTEDRNPKQPDVKGRDSVFAGTRDVWNIWISMILICFGFRSSRFEARMTEERNPKPCEVESREQIEKVNMNDREIELALEENGVRDICAWRD